MQIQLCHVAREASDEIIVECDCRRLKKFLFFAGAGWLMAWIFRDTLIRKMTNGAAISSLSIWAISAIALAASALWVAFGRRVAALAAGELRVHSIAGPLRIRKARIYPLADISDFRFWFQGVNDRGWKTMKRSIVFDYRGRMIVLFAYVPEHAADNLLGRYAHARARRRTRLESALDGCRRAARKIDRDATAQPFAFSSRRRYTPISFSTCLSPRIRATSSPRRYASIAASASPLSASAFPSIFQAAEYVASNPTAS
jgi:hypothetical protein